MGPPTAQPAPEPGQAPVSIPEGPEPATSTLTPELDDGCDAVPPATWLSIGSIHTIVMAAEPVTVRVVAEPATVCPGGELRATVTFNNNGTTTVTVREPFLLLSGGMDKWELGDLDEVILGPGEELSAVVDATIPLVSPGQYGLFVYGFTPGGVLLVEQPSG